MRTQLYVEGQSSAASKVKLKVSFSELFSAVQFFFYKSCSRWPTTVLWLSSIPRPLIFIKTQPRPIWPTICSNGRPKICFSRLALFFAPFHNFSERFVLGRDLPLVLGRHGGGKTRHGSLPRHGCDVFAAERMPS